MAMKQLKIAISGINATDNPGPGIPVAKSLKESSIDCMLIGLSYDLNDPGHYLNDFIDRSYVLPYPTNGWDGILERLMHIKETVGLDAVIPCLDAELPLYIKYSDSLSELGIKTFLPDSEGFKLRNKENLTAIAEGIGATYPAIWKAYSASDLSKVLSEQELPLMVKGPYYKAYKAHTAQQAANYFTSISQEWGFPILLQQIVHGEELNVVGVGDGSGGVLGMVAIKKQTITSLGKIWSGVTIHHEKLEQAARDFVRNVKWRGPFELECIVNDDDINLIEINPRFPAWAYFATGVGVNLPERLVQAMFDQPHCTDSTYSAGKIYMRFTDEVVCDLDRFSNLITTGASHAC